MSTRFYPRQTDYIGQLNNMDDEISVSSGNITRIAGEDISANMGVRSDGFYADSSDNLDLSSPCIGISIAAVSSSQSISIKITGIMTEQSWNWASSLPVYISTNGGLTQTPPLTGYVQQLGVALSATELLIEIEQPIQLI